jgi:hydroxymethylbilane synthase
MINGDVDIAHSMKDVPTVLPIGIVQAAVLKRAIDILVHKGIFNFLMNREQLPQVVCVVKHNG